MIKRIIKFIPKSEYMNIYESLFKSHLIYCISCWGGIPNTKLQSLFAIQKRCVRLLFGLHYSFDHPEFYETCARIRTYQSHMAPKIYSLEHTKPLFNQNRILNLFNLYIYHTFINTFKILKTYTPVSLYTLFSLSQESTHFLLFLPKITLDKCKNNFIFKSCSIWNCLITNIFELSLPNDKGIIVRGSSPNSDFCTPIAFVKSKLKIYLLTKQMFGNSVEWLPENSLQL